MNITEKIFLISKAIAGEVQIEKKYEGKHMTSSWHELSWDAEHQMFQSYACFWSVTDLLDKEMELRITPKLPKLTQDEKDWLVVFPQDHYITKSRTNSIHIHKYKPEKNEFNGTWHSAPCPTYVQYRPPFYGLRWEDDDCYTIEELRR
jgi:hypothetical protein